MTRRKVSTFQSFPSLNLLLTTSAAKAHYRRALANIAKKEDEDAEQDLVEALKYAPNDGGIQAELNRVRSARKAKLEKEKAKMRKMFA